MSNVAGLKECAEALAQTRGITKSEAESIMKDVVEILASKCAEGGVSFKGVFTIKKKVQKGRSGNFNGKSWKTEDKNVLSISTGKDLEKEMN
jgi:nucleoid DNA-binding protein